MLGQPRLCVGRQGARGESTPRRRKEVTCAPRRWRSESHVTAAFDEEGRQATRTLDGLGRELKRLDPNGNTTTYIYYGAAQDGRLQKTCDGENRCTTFEYDANGNVTRLIDNLNQDTATQYDALNRPVRIAQAPYPDTVLGAVRPITCYSYDLLGNLKEVKAGHSAKGNQGQPSN